MKIGVEVLYTNEVEVITIMDLDVKTSELTIIIICD